MSPRGVIHGSVFQSVSLDLTTDLNLAMGLKVLMGNRRIWSTCVEALPIHVINIDPCSEILKLSIESLANIRVLWFDVFVVIAAVIGSHLAREIQTVESVVLSNLYISLVSVPFPISDAIAYYNAFEIKQNFVLISTFLDLLVVAVYPPS